MTPARATALLAAAFIGAGIAFGSPPLCVPGVALAILDVGLFAWVRIASRGVEVHAAGERWSVTEGDRFPVRVSLRTSGLPLPGGALEHPMMARAIPVAVRPRLERESVLSLPAPGRGRHLLVPVSLLVADPLGLHRARVPGDDSIPLLVLPRVEAVQDVPGGAGASVLGPTGPAGRGAAGWRDSQGPDVEVDGLRPFRDGTPASRIHWPSVARSGELVERRLVSGGGAPPVVVLDSSDPAGPNVLDRAVRAAASLCAHLAARGGCSLVLPATEQLRIGSGAEGWDRAHAALALAKPEPLRVAGGQGSPGSRIFLVRAASRRGAATTQPPGGVIVVSPEPQPGMRTVFTVAGCHGQVAGHGLLGQDERAAGRAA